MSLAVGTGHQVFSALTSRATSIDYLLFWGVKALRFSEAGGIDATREDPGTMSFGRAGEVAIEFARHFEAGSAWIAWVVAVGVLAFAWRRWRELLPALLPTIGVLAFLFVYYLHFRGAGLADWIRWTMPRVSLSALGAALVGAAFTGAPSLTARVDPA